MQSQPLMQAILQTPSLTSLLAPNFSPNSSPPDLYVPMYDDLVHVPSVQGIEVAFTLLSKVFILQSIADMWSALWLVVYCSVIILSCAL